MTDLQTTDLIQNPFMKVNKGLEIVGNWPKHIRALAEGTVQEELRCACFYYIHKKTPKLQSEIMTDDITAGIINVIHIIQELVNEITGTTQHPVVVE
jgi:hypothetical protein